jgi:hypothetical protein
MKKINMMLMAIAISIPLTLNAQSYKSAFGFTSKISDNWLIVTRETVSKNIDILNFGSKEVEKMDSSLKSRIKKMALSGKMELLYYKNSDVDFYDNINLFIEQQQKSDINKRSKELCAILPQQIKQAYNRKDYTNMYYCKSEKVYGVNTISYSFDGAIYGTRSYGYYFNTKEATITLTITCKNSKCNEVKKDADLIFKKLELL